MPRKGSRSLEVDGRKFRYAVRDGQQTFGPERDDSGDPKEGHERVVTVQEDAERPGRVMQTKFGPETEVSPELVRIAVRDALRAGWDPSERGSAFAFG
jgi:hypothetical protein